MDTKKSCHNCKFKGTVPGSAHSSCNVITESASDQSKAMELMLLLSTNTVKLVDKNNNDEPLVKLNPHGVKNGWANWPLDFDPIWVENCLFHAPND